MANLPNNMPISLDTDITSYGNAQTLQATHFGIRPYKIVLAANATSVAGTVTITNPVDGSALYPPMVVTAAAPAGTVLFVDAIDNLLTWKDWAVTGLTATSTRLFVYYRA